VACLSLSQRAFSQAVQPKTAVMDLSIPQPFLGLANVFVVETALDILKQNIKISPKVASAVANSEALVDPPIVPHYYPAVKFYAIE